MGKKQKSQKTIKENIPQAPDEPISALGRRIIAAGVVGVICGFFVLSRTDPLGQNWASHLSPFLILGGYALIAIGIFFPEKTT
ncbi:MAG: hypothetical protein AAB425_06195 [Bdellovibrionota bacterium]